MKVSARTMALNLSLVLTGSAIFALSVDLFLDPYNIVPGGITGTAMLLNELFPILPIGMTALVINIPLFIFSWRMLGHRFLLYTIFGTVMSSVFIDCFTFLPHIETDTILAAVAGGTLMGVGLGIVFSQGATTGGSDIIARLLKMPFPHIQIGQLMLVIDGVIIFASIFVFKNINAGLCAAIAIYISSKTMDAILYGMNIERVAYIMSGENAEIVKAIDSQLERGATLLHAEGGYTGEQGKVILCAIKRQQISLLKKLVKEIDPAAFIILTEANEVLGEGFSDHNKTQI